ncbi:hypothetical protein OG225_40260 (plasmid) [Nocardia sp. NBC_01377]|uniref:hypothetical protein n=1 Tax=Nocardia sp. NBC_01377 TaxID=2903595 RepID=UPI00324BD994
MSQTQDQNAGLEASRRGPRGARQQLAYLFVAVALREAARGGVMRRQAMASLTAQDRAAMRTAVEGQFLVPRTEGGREQAADQLRIALMWRDTSSVAARLVEDLVADYRVEEGLIIDVEAGTVDVDPAFDAPAQQKRRALTVQHNHHLEAVFTALTLLRRSSESLPTGVESALVVPASRAKRVALTARLRELGVGESDSKTAVFVLAYLSGETADLDYLVEAPTLIDPGEEIKPVVADALADLIRQVDTPALDPDRWTALTGLLSPDDRELADTTRTATLTGTRLQPIPPWTDLNVDRRALSRRVREYRDQLRTAVSFGATVAASPHIDDRDWEMVQGHVAAMLSSRSWIEKDLAHSGLLGIEDTRLRHVMDLFDAGDIRADRLLFVSELALRETDLSLLNGRAERIATTGAAAITNALDSLTAPENRTAATARPATLDQESLTWQLSAIANGHPSSAQISAELTGEISKLLTESRASETTATVITSETKAWLQQADGQGQQIVASSTAWSMRITEVCAARDTASIRFAGRELGSPPAQASASVDHHAGSLIVAALPTATHRTAPTSIDADIDGRTSTDPGVEAEAQL